jgi:hypothetical protein
MIEQLVIVTTVAAWNVLLPQVDMCGVRWETAKRNPPVITVTLVGESETVACAEQLVKAASLRTPTPGPNSAPSECCGYNNINGSCDHWASLSVGGCKR